MDTILDRPWTTESFLAWEVRQEFKYEFDGQHVIPMAGSTVAHQRIILNLCLTLMGLLGDKPLTPVQAMRLGIGARIRYPDVVVCTAPIDQTARTLTDAVAAFEVLSEDTATTDRVDKLIEYAEVPSLRTYVLLEQTAVGATLFPRELGGSWIASAHTKGAFFLPGLDIALPLEDLYRGLTFPA